MDKYRQQLNYRSMNTHAGADFGIVLAGKILALSRALARLVFTDFKKFYINIIHSPISNY